MTLHQQVFESAIPDLREVPMDRLAELAGPVLATSIDLYLQRLQESSVPLSSFSSSI
jgi:FXSXX-COOH protein